MKLEPELVKRILEVVSEKYDGVSLLQIELEEQGSEFNFGDYTPDTIFYHFRVIAEERFFLNFIPKQGNFVLVSGLSMAGHDFLRMASNESVWQPVMRDFINLGAHTSIHILAGLLQEAFKNLLFP